MEVPLGTSAKCVVSSKSRLRQVCLFVYRYIPAHNLRDNILKHIALGDEAHLEVVLLTKVIPIVRMNSEAVMHRNDTEGLLRHRIHKLLNSVRIRETQVSSIKVVQNT